ncbi:MAG: LPS assembly protein LptD [Deltaproteobacteria bacterium]|nr:LPS assembly protein LptD [Deltaproteobacteria bacterium]
MKASQIFIVNIVAGWCLLASVNYGSAQTKQRDSQPGEQINVTADKLSISESGTQIEATGKVEIERQGTTLKADEVRVNRTTQDIEAKGNISLDDPEWKVKSAESIQLNLQKETGEIQDADLFIEQGHISISGRRFQKLGGQTYHIDDSFFTTCLCESGPAPWKFSAEQTDLTAGGLGIIKNGYFYILDVPVFYLPYAFFPLKTERQSGFLFPTFGHSTEEGFRFQQPFFWAISKSTDTTLAFDFQSLARIGFLNEFRTLFDRDSDFQLQTGYFNESLRQREQGDIVNRTIADPDIPVDRWGLMGTHRYDFAGNWLTYSDIAAYRDDLYTRELIERHDLTGAQVADIRRSRFASSKFGVFRSWGDSHFQGEWNFYQDFIQPDAMTLHRTPQVSYWGRKGFEEFPLELRWRAGGVNYIRREGGDGMRLDLRPEFLIPFRTSSYWFGSFSMAPRQTFYHLFETVRSSDRNLSRELLEIRGNLGTSLSRIFAWNRLGIGRVKHVIEPELNYLFVPSITQSSIPIMDGIDRVNRRNVLTFGMTNRFSGKSLHPLADPLADQDVEPLNIGTSSDVRELGSLRLALTYDIDRERKGGDTLSDLDMNLTLTPTSYLSFGFDGGLDPGKWDVTQARASVGISDPRPIMRRSLDPDFNRPNSLNFGYHYLTRGVNGFLADNANIDCIANPLDPGCPSVVNKTTVGNLVLGGLYHITGNLLMNLNSTYDSRENRFLNVRAAVKILSTCECWTLTLGMHRDINPDKTSFNFNFSLLGLGTQRSSLN